MMVHAYNPGTWKLKQDLKFQATEVLLSKPHTKTLVSQTVRAEGRGVSLSRRALAYLASARPPKSELQHWQRKNMLISCSGYFLYLSPTSWSLFITDFYNPESPGWK